MRGHLEQGRKPEYSCTLCLAPFGHYGWCPTFTRHEQAQLEHPLAQRERANEDTRRQAKFESLVAKSISRLDKAIKQEIENISDQVLNLSDEDVIRLHGMGVRP